MTCSRWRSTTWHPCKMSALLLDPAAGRRTVTHCYRIRNTLTYTSGVRMSRLSSLTCGSPNSPDLNPVDYAVWGAIQQMVYQRRRFTTINHLKQAIVIEWGKLSLRFIDHAIECVVQQQGGHTEHLMYKLHNVTVTLDNIWDNKHVVFCCYFLKMCCYRIRLVFNCCF